MSEPCLFLPDAANELCAGVAVALGVAPAPLEERRFEDGEHKARPLASVRGRDVYVLEPLYGDATHSVDERLVRLLLFVGTLKDAGASRVTAVVPYLAYARKDRRSKPRDPVSTRYVAQLFEAVGTDAIVTMDVHNVAAFQNAFRCLAENLSAIGVLAHHIGRTLPPGPAVVVAPDAGGVKRAEEFRRVLERIVAQPVAMAFVEKHRSAGEVSGDAFVGTVEGATAIVVDDMICAGTTVVRAARACRRRGARGVLAAVTHGLFAGDGNVTLLDAAIDAIVTTDTVAPWRVGPALRERLTTVSVAPLFAEAIRRLHAGGSLVELLPA
jgi:ribose-phosphate pyrophosphokinase